MQVYRKVSLSRCWEITGKKPIGVRRVDVNKQDDINPKFKSRLVTKQSKTSSDLDLHVETTPLEALKVIIPFVATKDRKDTRKKRRQRGRNESTHQKGASRRSQEGSKRRKKRYV